MDPVFSSLRDSSEAIKHASVASINKNASSSLASINLFIPFSIHSKFFDNSFEHTRSKARRTTGLIHEKFFAHCPAFAFPIYKENINIILITP